MLVLHLTDPGKTYHAKLEKQYILSMKDSN
jgi:hypothetical protein